MNTWELRDLGYFAAILRHGGISAAGRHLGVAQPTLSHALARLEQQAGGPLLERHRRGVRATALGEVLAQHARAALQAIGGLDEALSAVHGLEAGRLRLGCIPSLMAGLLPRALATLHREHPGLAIEVRTVRSETAAQAVHDDTVQAALVAGEVERQGLMAYPCGYQDCVAVVPRGHSLAQEAIIPLKRLRDEPLLLLPGETWTGKLIADCCRRAGFEPRPALVLDSPEGLRELVRAGCGVSLLPEGYVASDDRDLLCRSLQRPAPRRAVRLLHRLPLEQHPALRALLQLIHPASSGRQGI